MPTLREITTDGEWERGEAILRQHWSHVSETFVSSWRKEDDYRLLGRYVEGPDDGAGSSSEEPLVSRTSDEETLVAVAGVYVQIVIHHERSLWVHDLVDEAYRNQGHGEALLAEFELWGEKRDCDHLALVCSGDNDEAAGSYEDAGMDTVGTVCEIDI